MAQDEVFEGGYRNGRLLRFSRLDVTGAGRASLLRVMELAFTDIVIADAHPRFITATHLLREGARQLTFFRSYGELRRSLLSRSRFDELELFNQIAQLGEAVGPEQAAALAWEWLGQAEYGVDEGDGASYRGWRAFNHRFGLVDDHGAAFVAVRPAWIYLPK